MSLTTPPSFQIFVIALLCGGAGIAARVGYVTLLAPLAFWLVTFGFLLLVLVILLRGLWRPR
ncbi:MAG TPA: hypothetical protein VIT66_12015 [Lysobacter sp.]|jgi:hypothetical protein